MLRVIPILLSVLATLVFAPLTQAQQIEMNSPGGSLTSNEVDPTPGVPFSVVQDGFLRFEISGDGNAPYILLGGNLAPASLFSAALNNQWFDLDFPSVFVFGDGINQSGGVLPAAFFSTNAAGVSEWSLPVNSALVGTRVAFQAFVTDPTQGSFALNLTATADYEFVPALTIIGSGFDNFNFPSGDYSFYGQSFSSISVSSQGWVRFGGDAILNEFNSNLGRFFDGHVGVPAGSSAAPCIAAAWDNFDMANGTTVITEITPGITEITWSGGSVFDAITAIATPFGSFSCIIDATGPGTLVTLDFSSATITTSIQNVVGLIFIAGAPLVGISDGGTAGATVNNLDLSGASPFVPAMGPSVLYQNFFDNSGTIFDLNGLILNFVDNNDNGDFEIL